jgi:integrase
VAVVSGGPDGLALEPHAGRLRPGLLTTCRVKTGLSATPTYWRPPGSVRRAGISKAVGPHTLRHAFITAALDAGVPLRDVQEAASHADPRTTMRYGLDRHATYIVAAFIAGAAR